MSALLWLRRDLRRSDHPALAAAAAEGEVSVVFVLDPALWDNAGPVRQAWLARTLQATNEVYDGNLTIAWGDPRDVIPRLASEVGARTVHVTRETTPYGARRDARVAESLAEQGVGFTETGTPYAVGPGLIRNGSGDPYKVFTPFRKAWQEHGWPAPATEPEALTLATGEIDKQARAALDPADAPQALELPEAGESAALQRWHDFLEDELAGYDSDRDRPDLQGTSRLSPYLKLGVLHPRTLLAQVWDRLRANTSDSAAISAGAQRFVTELAWREFYADVLFHNPSSAWHDLRDQLQGMDYDEPEDAIEAWREGETGYPIVDAGMRQLLATGWMHNRVRMITASFLTKDLHVWWPVGARHFLDHLIDGDLASNNHGWQWVAGTGTDASPYFRVFNPVTQGEKFDPNGDYVREWIPQLRHIPGKAVHQPWDVADGYSHGYPARIIDHASERREALERLKRTKN